jgi:hypothetical protein
VRLVALLVDTATAWDAGHLDGERVRVCALTRTGDDADDGVPQRYTVAEFCLSTISTLLG